MYDDAWAWACLCPRMYMRGGIHLNQFEDFGSQVDEAISLVAPCSSSQASTLIFVLSCSLSSCIDSSLEMDSCAWPDEKMMVHVNKISGCLICWSVMDVCESCVYMHTSNYVTCLMASFISHHTFFLVHDWGVYILCTYFHVSVYASTTPTNHGLSAPKSMWP